MALQRRVNDKLGVPIMGNAIAETGLTNLDLGKDTESNEGWNEEW